MIKKLSLFASTIFLASGASSQGIFPASEGKLQAQITRDAQGYKSCGIRGVFYHSQDVGGELYDIKLWVARGVWIALMAGGKDKMSDTPDGKSVTIPVIPGATNFWIAKNTDAKRLMPTEFVSITDPKYVTGAVDLADGYKTALNIIGGERMQFALRYADQTSDTIISFSKKLPEDEEESLRACFKGVFAQMKSETEKKTNKNKK